jgi:monoamine oxidase
MTQTVVIGAGLAGLSAAYELLQAGQDVQLLEASDRIGGRAYTVPLNAGQYGEFGAEFVDEHHTALKAYAAEFNLALEPALGADDLYWWVEGNLYNWESLPAAHRNALEQLDAELSRLLEQQADPAQTLEQWLKTASMPPFACRMAHRDARSLFTTDAEKIGVGFFAYISGTEAVNQRIRDGSSRLADAFAQRLGERIHTGMAVRGIRQQAEQVILNVESTGMSEMVAEQVVVAIPWSVLRHLPIDAPLTDGQRTAIAQLSYGKAVKTLVQYPYRFWEQANFGIVLVEGDYQAIWEPTFAQAGTETILACLSGGTPSLHLGEQANELAEHSVRTLYPNAPQPIGAVSYNWNTNEWAQGAYCYFAPGDLHRFHPVLTLPAGQVFFAGEHTAEEKYRGYMEGALRSGQRAAQQILARGVVEG